MKRSLHQRWSSIAVNVALAALVVGPVYAASSIGTNLSTGGTLTVTGASTLTGAVTATGGVASGANITVPAAYALDVASAGVLNLGTTTATTVNIGRSGQTQALLGNATVAGTLNVTGASTLTGLTSMIQASSTRLSVFDRLYIGGTATTTILGDSATSTFSGGLTLVAGNINLPTSGVFLINNANTLSATALGSAVVDSSLTSVGTLTGLTVSGLANLNGQASTTRLSVFDTAYFGGTATSTFTSAGVLSLQNGETISNATDGTITLTAATTTLSARGIFTTGYVSQASSTVVGDLTVTGTFSPTQTTATTFAVGGGYGDTGATIAATGNIDTNGVLSLTGGTLNLGTGSATSTFTSASGLLGVGSTTPRQILSVQGNTLISGDITSVANITATGTLTVSATSTHAAIVNGLGVVGAPSFTFTGDLNNGIWSSGADTINFSTAGAERIRIDSSGNLGIGTTTPTSLFGLHGNALISGNITSVANITATGTLTLSGTTGTSTIASGQGFTVGTNQLLVQQSSGNVGIGITNPNTKFEVVGTASTTNLIVGGNGTTLTGIIAGYCSFSDVTSFTASTTKYADCTTTPTGALTTATRVFVQATSSLESMYVIQAASSTGISTINLRILNTGLDGAADSTLGGTSINFWAFR